VTATSSQERSVQLTEVALEIILPNNSQPLRLEVPSAGRGATLINRQLLTINDLTLAGDFTAIDVWAEREGDEVRVRLSIIYNDLSNPEWWKNKNEKVVGSLFIREGKSARSTELARFGIEPLEMTVIEAAPAAIQPDAISGINNNTTSLEVVRLEKSPQRYEIWLKNNSSKSVVAYYISIGNSGISFRGSRSKPALAAGAISDQIAFYNPNTQKDVTIPVVMFDDGSFEGDFKLAAQFQANEQGVSIQAPNILRLVEQALEADDAVLQAAFDKLEAQLWVIPEAIDKQSAIELLKSKYPSFDDKTISILYEKLKGGLYEARNRALSPIGDIKRTIHESEQRKDSGGITAGAKNLRERLTRIKHEFEALIATAKSTN